MGTAPRRRRPGPAPSRQFHRFRTRCALPRCKSAARPQQRRCVRCATRILVGGDSHREARWNMILLWGPLNDGPLAAVHRELRRHGVRLAVIDQRDALTTRIEMTVSYTVQGLVQMGERIV